MQQEVYRQNQNTTTQCPAQNAAWQHQTSSPTSSSTIVNLSFLRCKSPLLRCDESHRSNDRTDLCESISVCKSIHHDKQGIGSVEGVKKEDSLRIRQHGRLSIRSSRVWRAQGKGRAKLAKGAGQSPTTPHTILIRLSPQGTARNRKAPAWPCNAPQGPASVSGERDRSTHLQNRTRPRLPQLHILPITILLKLRLRHTGYILARHAADVVRHDALRLMLVESLSCRLDFQRLRLRRSVAL